MTERPEFGSTHPRARDLPDEQISFGPMSAERYGDMAFLTSVGTDGYHAWRIEITLDEFRALQRGDDRLWKRFLRHRTYGRMPIRMTTRHLAMTALFCAGLILLGILTAKGAPP